MGTSAQAPEGLLQTGPSGRALPLQPSGRPRSQARAKVVTATTTGVATMTRTSPTTTSSSIMAWTGGDAGTSTRPWLITAGPTGAKSGGRSGTTSATATGTTTGAAQPGAGVAAEVEAPPLPAGVRRRVRGRRHRASRRPTLSVSGRRSGRKTWPR